MTIDYAKDRPIYLQLVEKICGDILKERIQVGEKLPSVREFAVESGVNVNTIQRVYKELEHMQLTETKRGQGTFITTNTEVIQQMREQMKAQLAEHIKISIQSLGFSIDEIFHVLGKDEIV